MKYLIFLFIAIAISCIPTPFIQNSIVQWVLGFYTGAIGTAILFKS